VNSYQFIGSALRVIGLGKGEKVSVRAHRVVGNINGRVNPTWSKTK